VDTEALRPSDAAAGGERAAERATERATTPRRLQGLLRGDLDNIVAKALKKRPAERYSSAEAMAEDVRRFLAHEPVSARADTLRYRAAKFVRRKRAAVALAALAWLALGAGVAGTVSQARRADREARAAEEQRDFALRQLSRAEAINDLNSFLLSEAAPQGQPFTAGELLARAERIVDQGDDPDGTRVELMVSIGHQYDRQDEVHKARRVLERAYALARTSPDPTTRAKAGCALAAALATTGEKDRAEQLFKAGLAELRPQPTYALHRFFCLSLGSRVAAQRGDATTAVERAEAALSEARDAPLASALVLHNAQMTLGSAYQRVGRYRAAAASFEEGYRQLSSIGRAETHGAATLLGNWGLALRNLGQPLKAEPLLRRAIQITETAGNAEGVTAQKLVNIGLTLEDLDRHAEARVYAERSYEQARRTGQDAALSLSIGLRADVYRQQGDVRRAAAMVAELEQLLTKVNRRGHVMFAVLASQRSSQAKAEGNLATALTEADRAIALAEAAKAGSVFLPGAHLRRAQIALDLGRPERAWSDVESALRAYQERAGPDAFSSHVARAHFERGRALNALGRAGEAHAEFAKSLEHFESCLGPEHSATRRARELAAASSPTSEPGR
jgi:tetratricopeptide (TPR) repeat protein